MEIKQNEFRHSDTSGLPELPAPLEAIALPDGKVHDGYLIATGDSIGRDTPTMRGENGQAIQNISQVLSETPSSYEASLTQLQKLRHLFKSLIPADKYEKVDLGNNANIRKELLLKLMEQSNGAVSRDMLDHLLDEDSRISGEDTRWNLYRVLKQDSQTLVPAYQNINREIVTAIDAGKLNATTVEEYIDTILNTYSTKGTLKALPQDDIDILRERVLKSANSTLAAQEATRDATEHAIEALGHDVENRHNDQLMTDTVRARLAEYTQTHEEIRPAQIEEIVRKATEKVAQKLTVQALSNEKPSFIRRITNTPSPMVIPAATRPAEVPVPIGSSGRTEPVHQQAAEAPQMPERPQVNVQTAANAILARARTDVPRRIETEATRLFRERRANNPDAVAGQQEPLHQETYDEMITRNIDTYLMNQREGTANPQTRADIEALVREGLHVSQERSVQQAAASPSPEPPNPPDKPSEIPKAPVLSDYLTKLSRDLALTAQGELAKGNSEPVKSIVETQIKEYEKENGPLNQSNRDALADEIQIRVQKFKSRHEDAAEQRNPQPITSPPIAEVNPSIPKKKGLMRTWLDIMTGKS